MKKLLLMVIMMFGIAFTANATAFNSNQVGTSTPMAPSGYVLQSQGNNTPAFWVSTTTLGTTVDLSNYVTFPYASSSFPSFAYASSTYYFASNPANYITTASATSTFPSFAYASSSFVTYSYGTSTYATILNYPTYGYASSSFVSFPYASSTFASTSFIVNNFPTYSYASSTFASTTYLVASYVPYTGATSNVNLGSRNLFTTGFIIATSSQFTFATTTNLVFTGLSKTFLAVDSNGLVIATTSPSGGTGTLTWVVGNGSLYNATSSDKVGIGTSTPNATLDIFGSSTNPTLDLFGVSSSSNARLFTITSAGLVGIGTTTPTVLLEMSASNTATYAANGGAVSSGVQLRITNTSTSTVNNMSKLVFNTYDASSTPLSADQITSIFTNHAVNAVSGDLAFQTRNSGALIEAMRITASGNVGIGTSTPVGLLDIYGQSGNTDILRISSSSNARIATVTSGGSLAIGTTTASASLSIAGTGESIQTPVNTLTALNIINSASSSVYSIGTSGYATTALIMQLATTTLGGPTNGTSYWWGVKGNGHVSASSTPPILSSCGTNPSVVHGTDNGGYFTVGSVSANACTMTFSSPFQARPYCIFDPETGSVVNAATLSISTTAVTFTETAITGDVIDYMCGDVSTL